MVLRFKGSEKSKLLWLYFAFSVGIEKFLPWNSKVPPLELKSSCLGTKKFQEGNHFWNS